MSPRFFVNTSGGLAISVRTEGDDKNVTCILIHGLADGMFVWANLFDSLASHCGVVGLDLRGHGNSGWHANRDYSIDAYVTDLVEVIGDLNLEKFILIGHSLGGIIATEVAKMDSRVVGLVLVDAGPADPGYSAIIRQRVQEGFRGFDSKDEYRDWLTEGRPLATDSALRMLVEHSLADDGSVFRPRCDPAVALASIEHDEKWWLAALSKCSIPTLVVRGAGSAFISQKIQSKMLSVLKRGTGSTVPASGHSIVTDNLEGLVRVIKPFVLALTVGQ